MAEAGLKFCRGKSRAGFSLVESILALFLFSLAAYVIGTACYNCVYPLDIKDKDAESDVVIDLAVKAILNVSDYDSLDDGVDVDTPDGDTLKAYAEAEPTQILDLFRVEVTVTGKGVDKSATLFVSRKNWYQHTGDRDDLKQDRQDYLEDLRSKRYFNR